VIVRGAVPRFLSGGGSTATAGWPHQVSCRGIRQVVGHVQFRICTVTTIALSDRPTRPGPPACPGVMQQTSGCPVYYGSLRCVKHPFSHFGAWRGRLRRNASVPFGRCCPPGGAYRVGRYLTTDDDDLGTEVGVPEPDCRSSDPLISGVDVELNRMVETSDLRSSEGLPVSSISYETRGWG
jgi:hypothetical protein